MQDTVGACDTSIHAARRPSCRTAQIFLLDPLLSDDFRNFRARTLQRFGFIPAVGINSPECYLGEYVSKRHQLSGTISHELAPFPDGCRYVKGPVSLHRRMRRPGTMGFTRSDVLL